MRDKKCEIKMRDKNAIGKNNDRPARTPNVVFVVVSHNQNTESLRIIVLLSQACLLGIYLFCKI